MQAHDRVHLWIGSTFKPKSEYDKYFELDLLNDIDSPKYVACQFCKDIGDDWYDEDFIGIIPRRKKEIDLSTILIDAAIDQREWPKVMAICADYGITKANAIFWYADGRLKLPKPYKADYNGLRYIGVFKGD
jgi:Immunity protein 22